MGMYYCHQCDNHKDNDYEPCEAHSYSVGEMVCPDCAVELEEEMRECYLEDYQE
jgi:hypothetical protein